MTRVFLIRHAEAEGNTYRRAHGSFDGYISGRGHIQIEQLKARFLNEEVSAVYSSDLYRARTTAKAISQPRGLDVVTNEKLREVDMGVWEDEAWGDLYFREPEMIRAFSCDPEKWRAEGCESYLLVQERMYNTIRSIADRHDGRTIAFFSHGYAIRSFLYKTSGADAKDFLAIPYFDNTAVTLLIYNKGSFRTEYMGDNSHLKTEASTFANQTWWRSEEESAMENMYYMPLDETRDNELLKILGKEGINRGNASKEYTALITDGAIGMIGLGDPPDSHPNDCAETGWIEYLYLAPDYRGKCYEVQLIGLAMSEFRKQGKVKMRVAIPTDDDTIKFYNKYEFYTISKSYERYLIEKDITLPGKDE